MTEIVWPPMSDVLWAGLFSFIFTAAVVVAALAYPIADDLRQRNTPTETLTDDERQDFIRAVAKRERLKAEDERKNLG